jgi:hypothetical protein
MDQTAVEWLIQELFNNGYFPYGVPEDIVKKAKEMEVKQRQADTNHGYAQGYDDAAQGKEPMQPETL